jgi:uncharacterized membrane protein YgdD (TMEM256/DUF423 family)
MVRLAGLFGLTGVVLGAFGAHGLRERLDPGMLEVYRTGVLYHLLHAVALLAIGLSAGRLRYPRVVTALWAAGIVIFSGSLYALALTGVHKLGAITPLGGLAFIAGWAVLLVSPARRE